MRFPAPLLKIMFSPRGAFEHAQFFPPVRSQRGRNSNLLTGGAAAEFKKMSALSGIKSTPLCSEKDGIRLERIVFFYCERLISQQKIVSRSMRKSSEQHFIYLQYLLV